MLKPLLLLFFKDPVPQSAPLWLPWRCGTWLAHETHPPSHGEPPCKYSMWRFCNIPRYQTFHIAVAILKEVHYWKPFVGPLIGSLALLADSWLRLWRQLWQRRRCRDLGRSGSSASPSPVMPYYCLFAGMQDKSWYYDSVMWYYGWDGRQKVYRSIILPFCIVQLHTGPDPWRWQSCHSD